MPPFAHLVFRIALVLPLPFIGGCSSLPLHDHGGQQSEEFRDYVDRGRLANDEIDGEVEDEVPPDLFSPRARKISKNLGY